MFACQYGPMSRISAHYNEVCHGYGPLPRHLPLKHLDLHSWMSSAWSVVLWSCHIIFSYFFFTNYRTPGFYLRKNFNTLLSLFFLNFRSLISHFFSLFSFPPISLFSLPPFSENVAFPPFNEMFLFPPFFRTISNPSHFSRPLNTHVSHNPGQTFRLSSIHRQTSDLVPPAQHILTSP